MATYSGEWENGLFEGECGTCWGSWCCACFTFGRTHERLRKFPDTNRDNFSLFNGSCGILCATSLCHLGWVPILMRRGEVREKFGIAGNACTDCLLSYFCSCCAIAQMEGEVKKRATGAQMSEAAYSQPQGGMAYQPMQ